MVTPVYAQKFYLAELTPVLVAQPERREPNISARKALMGALGTSKTPNWTVCHIWGVDDEKFGKSNRVVQDPRFYSCVGNMVLLPTPLKGFTDSVPEIKKILRVCAFNLYGWACEHQDVEKQAEEVKSGIIPDLYPANWPTSGRKSCPKKIYRFDESVQRVIENRKADIRRKLNDDTLAKYPREQVLRVLDFWKIDLYSAEKEAGRTSTVRQYRGGSGALIRRKRSVGFRRNSAITKVV